MALEIAKYFTAGSGFLAMPAAPMRAYVRSREGLSAPDLSLGYGIQNVPGLYGFPRGLNNHKRVNSDTFFATSK